MDRDVLFIACRFFGLPAQEDAMTQTFDPAVVRNTLLASLGDQSAAYPERTVALFPHIASRLSELWGTPDGEHYLHDLLVCDRSDRKGFPEDVAVEIFRLSVLHSVTVSGEGRGAEWGDPTEVQLRFNGDALRRIAERSVATRRSQAVAA
jgi:hypothetical protein